MCRLNLCLGFVVFFFAICSCSDLQETRQKAGSNWKELEKVLHRYEFEGDEQKVEAVHFLLKNMPYHSYPYSEELERAKVWFRVLRERSGEEMSAIRDSLWGTMSSEMEVEVKWDVQELDSAYLCENIDMAFKAWREQPWGKNVDFETFCEYILPYRIDDESPVIWRKAYYEKFNPMLDEFRNSGMFDEEDPVEALKFLMKKLPILYEPKYSQDGLVNFPHIGPEYVQYVSGSCREYSDFVIYVCRSLGIPCAFNQVFNMHRVNVGHCWANFWNKYGEEYIISNYPPVLVPNRQDYTLATPKHKVYRRTYSINCGQLEKVKTSSEPLSYFFSIPTYKDVTAIYTNRYLPELSISVKSLNVELQENRPVYLCSSNRMDWFPEDFALVKNDKLVFNDIQKGEVSCLCVMYNGDFVAISDPFIIDAITNELHYLKCEESERVVILKSKFFVTKEEQRYRNRMINGIVEAANTSDFDEPDTLYIIQSAPDRRLSRKRIYEQNKGKYRYLKYKGAAGSYCDVADVSFYDSTGNKIIPMESFGTQGIDNNHEVANMYDGNSLTSFSNIASSGGWGAVALNDAMTVSFVEYTPRNRDNFIKAGDMYELFYYDGEWRSLGQKVAESDSLIYNGVPEDCLLILRNHSGGVQERIFTYENGRQVWR